jgi:hypothetical protein
LEILLSVEGNVLGLHLTVFDVDFVSTDNHWDIFANTNDISVPVRNVLVGQSAGHIKHDNGALTLDVVTISKATKLLLTSGIPNLKPRISARVFVHDTNLEDNLTVICVECQRVNFDSHGSNVLLLEFPSAMSFNEGGLSGSTITNEQKFPCRDLSLDGLR